MAGLVVAYGSQLPNTIIYYTPHDLPPSLPPMAGPVYLSWLWPCNYLPASDTNSGGGGGGGLPYDDSMIYIFVCVRVRGGGGRPLVPEGGISYERGGQHLLTHREHPLALPKPHPTPINPKETRDATLGYIIWVLALGFGRVGGAEGRGEWCVERSGV